MKRFLNQRSGFSLIEMLMASLLILVLSAASYKILTGQGRSQRETVFGMKKSSRVLSALDRFKKDASQIDYNWTKYGVSSVYPHQGLGLGENFYVTTLIRPEGLNDGVTFLRRNSQKADLYTLSVDAEFPVASAGATLLYNTPLQLVENTTQLAANDWVLIFQAGKYALGVIESAVNGTPATITIRQPNAAEAQTTHMNTFVGRSSGYVTKAGVVPASYDYWTGDNTLSTADDSITFAKNVTQVQPVWPVSYELDWATNDGQTHGVGNSYVLDEDGKRKKVVVRTDYTDAGLKREYLAETELMGLTYEVLSTDDFNSDAIKDIGRDATNSIYFVNLAIPADDPTSTSDFIATSRILSLRMFMGSDQKAGNDENQKMNEVSVALDPSRNNSKYSDDSAALAMDSGNLAGTYDFTGKQIGQPLYIYNGGDTGGRHGTTIHVSGDGGMDVVVPVSIVDVSGARGNGKLIVLDEAGEPATANTRCAATHCEEITFGVDGGYFSPATLTESHGSSTNTIFVGGFAVTVDARGGVVSRQPAMMKIEYPKGTKFRDYVAANNGAPVDGRSNTCSLGASCQLVSIDSRAVTGSGDNLKDTAAGVSVTSDAVYVASVTRTASSASTLSVYKTDATLASFEEKIVDDTGLAANSVISAIGQTSIKVAGTDHEFLPICTTRSINEGATPSEDGKILLYDITSATPVPPITIANHNFMCKSLTQMNGNLVVAGKLVTQVLKAEEIAAIVQATQSPKTLYTDEIANVAVSGPTPTNYYADGYYTFSSAYANQAMTTFQQVLGGNMGANVLQYSDMEFGVVFGNKAYVSGGTQYEVHDFTTVSVNFGGVSERVLASIDTNFDNLNESEVVSKYDNQPKKVPSVILPGQLYYDPLSPRQTLAPLPALTRTMDRDEIAWGMFYLDLIDTKDQSSPRPTTVYLPDPTVTTLPTCDNGMPATCS